MRTTTSLRKFGLALLGLIVVSSAQAQLTAPQMQAARAFITAEKFVVPDLKTDCLDLVLPSGIVRTQKELDALSKQIDAKNECVQDIRNMTFEPNVRSMLETAYPKANGAQTSELTALALDVLTPIRQKAIQTVENKKVQAYELAYPFMAKQQVEAAFEKEANRCDEPPARTFASVIAAQIFLEGYRKFEICLNDLTKNVRALKPKAFVEQHYASSSDAVRTFLLQELPAMQDSIVKQHAHRLALSRTPRAIAQAYYDAHKDDDEGEGWDEGNRKSK